MTVKTQNGHEISSADAPPMLIMAEATEEDWRESVLSNGGKANGHKGQYLYFVATD